MGFSPDIIKKYFSHLDKEKLTAFEKEMQEFEQTMNIPPIDGALEFIAHVKNKA